jgi:hypothetical protein
MPALRPTAAVDEKKSSTPSAAFNPAPLVDPHIADPHVFDRL